jgi:sigma-E factor negative regulatory protein RseC
MKNKGIVIKNNDDDKVTVKVFKDSACSHCSGCSDGSKFAHEYTFNCKDNLEEGDTVNFEIADSKIMKISFLIYILPVLLLFLMYYLAGFISQVEGVRVLASFAGIVLYFLIIYIIDRKLGHDFLDKNIKINKGDS